MARAELRERFTRRWLTLRGVAFVSVAAISVLSAGCLSVLLQSRLELVRRADIMAANILLLADQTVQIEVRRYDLRLLDVIADLRDPATRPAGVPSAPSLFGGLSLRRSIGDIIIVDARGRVLASSRPDVTARYAVALPSILASPGAETFGLGISTVLPADREQPLIALTRSCAPDACGQASAVVAMLPMAWIQGVFGGLVLGRDGAMTLTDGSGTLLARQPTEPGTLGRVLERQALIARIHRTGMTVYNRTIPPNGQRFRVTSGWVDGLPLLVSVSISYAEILRGWRHLAFVIIFAVVLLAGGLVALTLLLAREVHRKMKVDEQLLSANALLAEMARTDWLTGLLNRRGFDDSLVREWRRCYRNGKPISLMMLDADHFKAYNDRFGHQAGDGVLRALGACIVANIRRPGDVAARYGGEEFTVVLPDTDTSGAGKIAEAIRAGVEALAIPHVEDGRSVTVSVGVSTATPEQLLTAEDLLAAADAALYDSKAAGRNRVTPRAATPQPAAEPART
ncbi:sensor domain-containing diguanylate cyclase [Acidisoma sp.]|uniref:sensor domain-containing diguanylate cyclase n=1 Tax=Acidisoma sp. TaxID=1872115 RepID=UPI003B00DD23